MKKILAALLVAVMFLPTLGVTDCTMKTIEGEILSAWLNEYGFRRSDEMSVDIRGCYEDTYVFYIEGLMHLPVIRMTLWPG